MRSPTQRTLKYLRERGNVAAVQVVEHYIKFPHMAHGVRRDLWGADILCVQGMKLIAIQTCAGSSHSDRVNKSLGNESVGNWLVTGNLFEIWSWAKRGPRGKRKLWTPRVTQLTLNGDGQIIQA
jgi:hypothetical protein